MPVSKLGLGILCVLGLAAGVAIAAVPTKPGPVPTTKPGPTPTPGLTCPTPTKAQCLAKKTDTSPAYLETTCGRKHKETCRPFVEAELEKNHNATPGATVKVFKPKGSDIPADLRDGKRMRTYGKPAVGKAVSVPGKNLLSRTKLTVPPAFKKPNPAEAHRNPSWETNGEAVASCEEFAYEEMYDWARFTDAAAACAGDTNCIIEIALLPQTPGIGERKLKSKNGKDIGRMRKDYAFVVFDDPGKIGIYAGPSTKNDMFVAGQKFVYSGGPDGVPESPDLETLKAVLATGEKYYKYGKSCGKPPATRDAPGTPDGKQPCTMWQFKNEWAFHRHMYEQNGKLSKAEFSEYAARKAKFRQLLDEWGAATGPARQKMNELARHEAVQEWVSPLDMVSHDPFERIDMMRDRTNVANKAATKRLRQLGVKDIGAGTGIVTPPINKQLQPGASWQGGSRPATGVLAVPSSPSSWPKTTPLPTMSPASKLMSDCGKFPKIDPKDQSAVLKRSFEELFGKGPASCRVGEFLRNEWARMAKGQKSCLDLDNDDCDWAPEMFTARFAAGLPYIEGQQAAETACIGYTGGKMTQNTLDAAEQYIADMRKLIQEAMRKLEPYKKEKTSLGWHFGKDFTDAESTGDKDWFAAGYDYDLGWEVKPAKLDTAHYDQICELTGAAHGNVGVDGWLIGNQVSVIDGEVRGRVNKDSNHKTRVVAHLKIFGVNLFDPIDETFDLTYAPDPWLDTVQIPTGYKPSFTVMAGPVPITGAAWGELFYGAGFEFSGLPSSPTCNSNQVEFKAEGAFIPQIGLNAKAQVGVGISGIVSAGIRGMLNLVTVGVPIEATLKAVIKTVSNTQQFALNFEAGVDLSLSTLSGYLALYIEFLFFEEEWELFSWSGLSSKIELMPPLKTDLLLVGMK